MNTHRRAARRHRLAVHTVATRQAQPWRGLKGIDPVAHNGGAEAEFIRWLLQHLRRRPALSLPWIHSNAAYHLDLSPATIRRYLDKYTADAAPFMLTADGLQLKDPEYNSQEEADAPAKT